MLEPPMEELRGGPTDEHVKMIELLCTLTGIIAGVAIVASLVHQHGERQKFAADAQGADSDHISGIADQLQVISHRVAADVCAHHEKVVHISDRLAPTADSSEIMDTINEIISANQAMHGQLADAQKRIAQQSRMIEQASRQARTDALTGLANRRALNEFLANSIESLTAEGPVTGMLLLDIDHFKSFNDNFGHATGDAVLASFARSIATCCSEDSYAARYGGEEFAVVLVAKTIDELVQKATEVRYYASEQVISYEDLQLKITSSGGLCRLLPGDTCSAVCERADEGLYQAKKAGRNRGFWLSDDGWLPFPGRSGAPQVLSELGKNSGNEAPAAAPSSGADNATVQPISRSEAQATVRDATASKASAKATSATTEVGREEASQAKTDTQANEILDLNAFVIRLDAFVEQLRKANLPAAGFMVEGVGLRSHADSVSASQCWNEILETVQHNLRGIDVICQYRPFTLCVFMPGCSLDSGIARAARTKMALREAVHTWNTSVTPKKFSVSAAAVMSTEENAQFLNRLELALEEAEDATDRELVIHDGNICHFQEA